MLRGGVVVGNEEKELQQGKKNHFLSEKTISSLLCYIDEVWSATQL